MNFFFKKEKLEWGRRKVTLLGFKFEYISKIKKQRKDLINSLELFKSLSDITSLKPASGKLREHQLKLVQFSKEISDLLVKNEMRPFMIAGSLIGLLRHKGFVPWDDDIDFALPRNEYNRLLELIYREFLIIDNSTINIKKRNTFLTEINKSLLNANGKAVAVDYITHIKILRGQNIGDALAVDLFPMDYMSSDATIEKYKSYVREIHKNNRANKWADRCLLFLREQMKQSGLFSIKKTDRMYYGFDNLDAVKRKHDSFFETDIIFPLKEMSFEGEFFLVPNEPKKFLSVMLGGSDFMSYPPDVGYVPHIQEFEKFIQNKK